MGMSHRFISRRWQYYSEGTRMTITMKDKYLKDEWTRLVESMQENNEAVRSAYSKAIAALQQLAFLIGDSDM